MALKVDYVAKETAINLRRNLTLTFATVVTVAITLTFVGSALLARQGVKHANVQFRGDTEFIVYMNADAPQNQIDAVSRSLEENPQIKEFRYLDHAAAYEEAKSILTPELLENVTPEDLPTNFKVTPNNASTDLVVALSTQYEAEPGVREVVSQPETLRKMESFFSRFQLVIGFAAIVLGVAALVLIVNSIRIAMFARRREIEVMKLVGATNWFIRIPFMTEGMIQGLLGSLLGVGAIVSLRRWLLPEIIATFEFLGDFDVNFDDVRTTAIFMVATGVIAGAICSGLAATRFLDV
jgi:cell division transport system permease protein